MGRIHPRNYPKTDWQGIVLHYTAGHAGTPDLAGGMTTLRANGLSYHFIIDHQGVVHQGVDLGDLCQAHPGKNATHIGISYVNFGYARGGYGN